MEQKRNWKRHGDRNAGYKLGTVFYCWMRKSEPNKSINSFQILAALLNELLQHAHTMSAE